MITALKAQTIDIINGGDGETARFTFTASLAITVRHRVEHRTRVNKQANLT